MYPSFDLVPKTEIVVQMGLGLERREDVPILLLHSSEAASVVIIVNDVFFFFFLEIVPLMLAFKYHLSKCSVSTQEQEPSHHDIE